MKTELFIGPVTLNTIQAAKEFGREHNITIPLIASRNQIDSEKHHDGGYVMNTKEFSHYKESLDELFIKVKKPDFMLCRDHGGPYQNSKEKNLSYYEAMESAKKSYSCDIQNGFNFIHIDPSIYPHRQEVNKKEVFQNISELLRFCESVRLKYSKPPIIYEFGTEEQSGKIQDKDSLIFFLQNIKKILKELEVTSIPYFVLQTGTKIMETRQIGDMSVIDSPKLKEMINIVHEYGFKVKEHNTDYLDLEYLSKRPEVGIDACNVAPEFGVIETRTIMYYLRKYNEDKLWEEFVKIAYKSGKWKKWLIGDFIPGSESILAEMCGHYILNLPEVSEILLIFVLKHKIDINKIIRFNIKQAMEKYYYFF